MALISCCHSTLGLTKSICAASVVRSIELCDVDLRKDLYSGIVATGEGKKQEHLLHIFLIPAASRHQSPCLVSLLRSNAWDREIPELKGEKYMLVGRRVVCNLSLVCYTGGSSLFPQMRERLEKELSEAAPQAARVKVMLPVNTTERRCSVWIGEY